MSPFDLIYDLISDLISDLSSAAVYNVILCLQAIIEEKWGVRGGQRFISAMHNPIIGTDQVTTLKTIRQHRAVLTQLPGAVRPDSDSLCDVRSDS
jgi:hypothetical protein